MADASNVREFWSDAVEAMRDRADHYRGDRLAGQEYAIYIATEKQGLLAQLDLWFHEPYGIPVLPLGGWTSVSFINDVKADVAEQRALGRKTALFYAGDLDASGIPIGEVFARETPGCWDEIHRVALNPEQIAEYGLIRQRGKHNERAFVERFGPEIALYDPAHPYVIDGGKQYLLPVQVEMDALDPRDLRQLFADAIFGRDDDPDDHGYWDMSAYNDAMAAEERDAEHADLIAQVGERFTVEELRELLDARKEQQRSQEP